MESKEVIAPRSHRQLRAFTTAAITRQNPILVGWVIRRGRKFPDGKLKETTDCRFRWGHSKYISASSQQGKTLKGSTALLVLAEDFQAFVAAGVLLPGAWQAMASPSF